MQPFEDKRFAVDTTHHPPQSEKQIISLDIDCSIIFVPEVWRALRMKEKTEENLESDLL
jgi:hypothetical protein